MQPHELPCASARVPGSIRYQPLFVSCARMSATCVCTYAWERRNLTFIDLCPRTYTPCGHTCRDDNGSSRDGSAHNKKWQPLSITFSSLSCSLLRKTSTRSHHGTNFLLAPTVTGV
ncbi:hypothetical protein PIB30_080874 [Stylosanthes scabra]|uniref:Uncharacterized protein n=1 Tax=Stylosanthes scabra TaxID=79078 RepID=A0ABU6UQF0_9FABA|nr:hypothetical protein [Stylosanthes scabra]